MERGDDVEDARGVGSSGSKRVDSVSNKELRFQARTLRGWLWSGAETNARSRLTVSRRGNPRRRKSLWRSLSWRGVVRFEDTVETTRLRCEWMCAEGALRVSHTVNGICYIYRDGDVRASCRSNAEDVRTLWRRLSSAKTTNNTNQYQSPCSLCNPHLAHFSAYSPSPRSLPRDTSCSPPPCPRRD